MLPSGATWFPWSSSTRCGVRTNRSTARVSVPRRVTEAALSGAVACAEAANGALDAAAVMSSGTRQKQRAKNQRALLDLPVAVTEWWKG
jgi:hypothetical protein